MGRRQDGRELVALALAAHGRQSGGGAKRRPCGGRVGHEAEPARETCQAYHAQRVVGEGGRRAEPKPPRGEVVDATERVDDVPACERTRQRVDGEVAGAQVVIQVGPTQGGDVHVHIAEHEAPRAEHVGGGEHGGAQPVGERAREGLGRAVHDDVEVAHRQTEELVAQAAADEPAALAGAASVAPRRLRSPPSADGGRAAVAPAAHDSGQAAGPAPR